MWDQEKEHKAKFEELIPKYRARPTALLPFWNVAGYVLGAGKGMTDCDFGISLCSSVSEVLVWRHHLKGYSKLMTVGAGEKILWHLQTKATIIIGTHWEVFIMIKC